MRVLDFSKDHLPVNRLALILERLLSDPKVNAPETYMSFNRADLQKEGEHFVQTYMPDRKDMLAELTAELMWANQITKWDAQACSTAKMDKKFRVPTAKLAFASRLALESAVKKIEALQQEMVALNAKGEKPEADQKKLGILILALEAMRMLGRCDMLEHVELKHQVSKLKGKSTLPIKERHKLYHGVAREFLLEQNCLGKFSGVEELAEFLGDSKVFFERLCKLEPNKSRWFSPDGNAGSPCLVLDNFPGAVKAWGKADIDHGGWQPFLKPRKGRG